jgi:hypothetical protein
MKINTNKERREEKRKEEKRREEKRKEEKKREEKRREEKRARTHPPPSTDRQLITVAFGASPPSKISSQPMILRPLLLINFSIREMKYDSSYLP